MKNAVKFAGLLAVALLFQPMSAAFQKGESGAKSLFYDPAAGSVLKLDEKKRVPRTGVVRVKRGKPNLAKNVGLHYWIDLEGTGTVTADHTFHTGDRIRLYIRSNADGYLSLYSIDSSGHGTLLFPTRDEMDSEGYVKAYSVYVTPGMIKFSPPIEDERLLVIFSRSKADIPTPSGKQADGDMIASSMIPAGSKALVFETENKRTAGVGTYIVNRNGGAVIKEINLRHRPLDRR
jgi:hypothetical protein